VVEAKSKAVDNRNRIGIEIGIGIARRARCQQRETGCFSAPGNRRSSGAWTFSHRLAQLLVIRLLLVPIGVGVGIGIGIDSDCVLGLILTHGVASLPEFRHIATMRSSKALRVAFPASSFSCPNPIFYPSIPIPIPTPTPIIIPSAIRTRLSCIKNMSKHQGAVREPPYQKIRLTLQQVLPKNRKIGYCCFFLPQPRMLVEPFRKTICAE
jgi:hypothetical protein